MGLDDRFQRGIVGDENGIDSQQRRIFGLGIDTNPQHGKTQHGGDDKATQAGRHDHKKLRRHWFLHRPVASPAGGKAQLFNGKN